MVIEIGALPSGWPPSGDAGGGLGGNSVEVGAGTVVGEPGGSKPSARSSAASSVHASTTTTNEQTAAPRVHISDAH